VTVVRVETCATVEDNCGRMTIELTTAAAARALADYLERCECTVAFVSEHVLEVHPPARSQSSGEAVIEIEAYLRVWRAMNPMHAARLTPPAR
jgi:hypothetical protein